MHHAGISQAWIKLRWTLWKLRALDGRLLCHEQSSCRNDWYPDPEGFLAGTARTDAGLGPLPESLTAPHYATSRDYSSHDSASKFWLSGINAALVHDIKLWRILHTRYRILSANLVGEVVDLGYLSPWLVPVSASASCQKKMLRAVLGH